MINETGVTRLAGRAEELTSGKRSRPGSLPDRAEGVLSFLVSSLSSFSSPLTYAHWSLALSRITGRALHITV